MDTSNHPRTTPSTDRPDRQEPHPQVIRDRPAVPGRWAPWWVYLVVLLGANYIRAGLMPVGTVPEPVVVVIALAQAGALFVVITAGWRFLRRSRR